MTLRLLSLFFLLAAAPAGAQSVADYYHAAAQSYIGGENAEAERAAEAGLALAPNDAKLQALLDKIRERNPDDSGGEEQQDEADQQQDGEGEQQDEAQSGDQEGEESENEQQGEQQQPEGEQQQPEEPAEQEPSDQQQGDAGAEGEQEPANPQGGGTTPTPFDVKPGEMSRAEAERILSAVESDELELLRDVQRRRARPRYVEKDW